MRRTRSERAPANFAGGHRATSSCGSAPNRLHVGSADGEKEALEDGEVQALILQGEGEMPFESRLRFVTGRVDAPLARIDGPMAAADGREPAGKWDRRPGRGGKERIDQRGVADRRSPFRKPPLVKNRNRS
jgi:hypothetical protein